MADVECGGASQPRSVPNLEPMDEPPADRGHAGVSGRNLQLRRIAVNLGGVVAINLLALVTGPVLARALGPSERGILAAALLWPGMVAALLSLGISDAVTYYTAGGDTRPAAVLAASRVLGSSQAVAMWVVGFPVVLVTMSHFGASPVVSAMIYLALVPLNIYALYLTSLLNGLHRYGAFNVIQLVAFLVNALVLVFLWRIGDLSVRTAVLTNCVSIVLAAAAAAWVVRRSVGRAHREAGLSRKLLRFGLPSQLSNFPHLLNDRVDQLVLSLAVAPGQLGLYVVAATIATAPAFVGAAVASSVLPTLAAVESPAERVAAARRAVLLTMSLTGLGSVVLAVAMHPLIRIVFGRAFLGAVPSARILALAAVMISLARVFHGLLKGIGRPLDAGISEGSALLVTAVGLAISIPLLGILGAAITSVCAYSTSVAIGAWCAGRALGVHPIEFAVGKRSR